jgi:hypothetical protein
MLSYDLGFACLLQRQKNGLHGGRTYDQCHADSLRDGVSDRVMRVINRFANAYRRINLKPYPGQRLSARCDCDLGVSAALSALSRWGWVTERGT